VPIGTDGSRLSTISKLGVINADPYPTAAAGGASRSARRGAAVVVRRVRAERDGVSGLDAERESDERPGGSYTLVDGYTYSGYTILNPPQLADGGSDVTLTVNSATTIPGGQDMEVVIGGVGNASSAGAQELSVATTGDGTPSLSNPFQLVADPATSLSVVAGSPSSGQVGQAFSGPFEVEATDEYGNPVSGVSVTFAAPSSGPSGLLPTGAFPYGLSTDTPS